MPFITYLSGLLTAQMLSDDHLISGVEIRCEEKGRCPSTCHLCRRPGKEQLSPTPVLLEINRVVPLYALIQDNDTREVSERVVEHPGAASVSMWRESAAPRDGPAATGGHCYSRREQQSWR